MDLLSSLIIICFFYLWFFFMDRFFKSCSHYGYIQFLKGTGLEIKFLQFRWTTGALNFQLLKLGSSRPLFFNLWFSVGLYAGLILYPIAIYILLLAVIRDFHQNDTATNGEIPANEIIIQPVLPGVNLPGSEIGYYSLTLLISSVVHELGHALSAVQHDVTINNVGANVIFFLPVAYVNLSSDKLFSLNPWKRLKILIAGVWHNLAVAFVVYLVYMLSPTLFSIFYTLNKGVIVNNLQTNSPLLGHKGLSLNDVIVGINDCDTIGEDDWFKCLHSLKTTKPGFCVSADLVHSFDESVHLKYMEDGLVTCCNSDNIGKICFEYLDTKDDILEFPPYACLPGRTVIEQSKSYCTYLPHLCPKDTFCFRPILANSSNLYRIRRPKGNLSDVIYTGPVSDFLRTLSVSSYVPKLWFLTSTVPEVTMKFFEYMVVFSLGLAIGNVLPIFSLDGQYITDTIFHIAFSNHLRMTHIKIMSNVVCLVFTLLLVVHCIVFLYAKIIIAY